MEIRKAKEITAIAILMTVLGTAFSISTDIFPIEPLIEKQRKEQAAEAHTEALARCGSAFAYMTNHKSENLRIEYTQHGGHPGPVSVTKFPDCVELLEKKARLRVIDESVIGKNRFQFKL